jgi:hypothetical protein
MATGACVAALPLRSEGLRFWEGLVHECRTQIQAINSVLSGCGRGADEQVECSANEGLHLERTKYPSTTVDVRIRFEDWGPVLQVLITGLQRAGFRFFPEELEVPLATEGDGSLVAVFDEGRSLSPRELASYLTQHFRRCFPGIALPCPDAAFA